MYARLGLTSLICWGQREKFFMNSKIRKPKANHPWRGSYVGPVVARPPLTDVYYASQRKAGLRLAK